MFPPSIGDKMPLVRAAFRTPEEYRHPPELGDLVEAMIDIQKDDSLKLATLAVTNKIPHAQAYRAVALLYAGYGSRAAQKELDDYFVDIINAEKTAISTGVECTTVLDPIAFFAIYLMWKDDPGFSKQAMLRAADALTCVRSFCSAARIWLVGEDDIDKQVLEEGIDKDDLADESDDEEDDDIIADPKPDDPEYKWKLAKRPRPGFAGLTSASMDKLMSMTGMTDVKSRAIKVCLEVLNLQDRPDDIKAEVAMNFLFVGNPGTGKV